MAGKSTSRKTSGRYSLQDIVMIDPNIRGTRMPMPPVNQSQLAAREGTKSKGEVSNEMTICLQSRARSSARINKGVDGSS